MLITTSSYHVFGSGCGGASLKINGVRIRGNLNQGRNGFVGYMAADVPVEEILNASVEFVCWASPGGDRSFKGGGRHFVKWLTRCYPGRDPLAALVSPTWKEARLPKTAAALKDRRQAREAERLLAEIAAGKLRLDPAPCSWGPTLMRKETFRLPDGCRGGRWVPAIGAGNPFFNSGPHWSRVIAAARAAS